MPAVPVFGILITPTAFGQGVQDAMGKMASASTTLIAYSPPAAAPVG